MDFAPSRRPHEDDPSFFLSLARLYRPLSFTLFDFRGERRMGDSAPAKVAQAVARAHARAHADEAFTWPHRAAPDILVDVLRVGGRLESEGYAVLHGGALALPPAEEGRLLERFAALVDMLARHLDSRRLRAEFERDRLEYEKRSEFLLEAIRYDDTGDDLNGILRRVLERVVNLLGVDGGAILIEPAGDGAGEGAVRVVQGEAKEADLAAIRDIVHRRSGREAPFFLNDPFSIATLFRRPMPCTSMILAALTCGHADGVPCPLHGPSGAGGRLGTLALWNGGRAAGRPREFREVDREFVRCVVQRVVRQFYEESRRAELERAKRLEEQMVIARAVQSNLLPGEPPAVRDLEYRTHNESAQTIGGDFFDHHAHRDDLLLVALGDISGKGVPAALLHSMIQRVLHAEMDRTYGMVKPRAGEILQRLNGQLFADLVKVDMFATLLVLRIDLAARRIEFADAGHPFPLLLRAGRCLPFHEAPGLSLVVEEGEAGVAVRPPAEPVRPGMPVGFQPDTGYATWGFDMLPGDAALLYTDGLTEVFDSDRPGVREAFGDERLARAFERTAGKPADQALGSVVREVKTWSREAEPRDDMTAILFRYVPGPARAPASPKSPSPGAGSIDYTI